LGGLSANKLFLAAKPFGMSSNNAQQLLHEVKWIWLYKEIWAQFTQCFTHFVMKFMKMYHSEFVIESVNISLILQ
jgi:hypothetical protein